METKKIDWNIIFNLLNSFSTETILPSISQIAEDDNTPYRVLFSTILSLRTRDEVTLSASERLFKEAPDLKALSKLSEDSVAKIIYPVAFYNIKAKNIKECVKILLNKFKGNIPNTRELLLELPGVGRKTANLTLNLGFGINAICVDTHVHRISNRAGWVKTNNPEETEYALEKILSEKYWIPLNERIVTYGQKVCTPISPRCSVCVIKDYCLRINVKKSR